MLTRRELFRRMIGLPLVAGLVPLVARKRGVPWAIGTCEAEPGNVVHTLDTYMGRPFVYANHDPLPEFVLAPLCPTNVLRIKGGGEFVMRS